MISPYYYQELTGTLCTVNAKLEVPNKLVMLIYPDEETSIDRVNFVRYGNMNDFLFNEDIHPIQALERLGNIETYF